MSKNKATVEWYHYEEDVQGNNVSFTGLCEKKAKHENCYFGKPIPFRSPWVHCRCCNRIAHYNCIYGYLLLHKALDDGFLCVDCLLKQNKKPAGFFFYVFLIFLFILLKKKNLFTQFRQ